MAHAHREMAVGTRLVKHAWEYDELSRKSDIEFASAVTELAGITDIDLTYDDASRLIRERTVGGATTWDAEYAYSDGNRTDLEIDGTGRRGAAPQASSRGYRCTTAIAGFSSMIR